MFYAVAGMFYVIALGLFYVVAGMFYAVAGMFYVVAGMFFASTMVMVTIALVMAVTVTNIYAKKDTPQRCPQWTLRLVARFYPPHILPPRAGPQRAPPPPSKGAKGGDQSYEYRQSSLSPRGTLSPRAGSGLFSVAAESLQYEGQAYPALDEARQGTLLRAGAHTPLGRLPSITRDDSFETFDFERSEAEWRMVAKFTDRVFFWLFLAMSTFTQASLFLQMVPTSQQPEVFD